MRLGAAVLLAGLFALTTFVRSSDAEARALRHFDRATVERGEKRAFQRRCVFWARAAAQAALLGALVRRGRSLGDACERACRGRRFPAALLAGATLFLLFALVDLPFAVVAGWAHPRAWGLTDRALGAWLAEHGLALLLAAAVAGVALAVLHLLLRRLPKLWWAPAGAGAAALALLLSLVHPVWVAPLFNELTPLAETPHADLEPRIRGIAERAEVPVDRVMVVDASRQGRHTNAYFSGIGGTRVVALYDTLLASHPPEEVESIFAHELGHWRRDHVLWGCLFAAVGALAALFVAARVLRRAIGRPPLLLRDPSDPAAIPLLALLVWLAAFAGAPLESALSRRFEREADADAILLTGRVETFVESEKRLVRDNILDVAPPPVWTWMFATHPTPVERIEAALAAR